MHLGVGTLGLGLLCPMRKSICSEGAHVTWSGGLPRHPIGTCNFAPGFYCHPSHSLRDDLQ